MTFIRKIKKKSGTYLAEVKSYRENGKVKQKVVKYLGKEVNGQAVKRVSSDSIIVESVKKSLDVLAIDKIAENLGIKNIKNKYFLSLVYSQLLENKSLNKLAEWIKFTEIPELLNLPDESLKKFYESLSDVDVQEFEKINSEMAKQFRKYDNFSKAAVIDVTDTYFEGSSQNIKRRKGKESKVRKLTQIGLAVTFDHGFPIFHKNYQGNLSDVSIFNDMILELKQRGIESIIVDRGMTFPINLEEMSKLGFKIIAGVKKQKTLKEKYLSKIKREEIYCLKNRVKLKNTEVFIQKFKYLDGELIAIYNPAYEVLKKQINFERGKESKFDIGFSLIYHNTEYDCEKIVKKYFEKDIVERAFKQMKGVLNLRPIRVWLKEHIEGHIRICYLAYAILSMMDYKLRKDEFSAVEALNLLKTGYKVRLNDVRNNHKWDKIVELEPKQKKVLRKLKVVYKN